MSLRALRVSLPVLVILFFYMATLQGSNIKPVETIRLVRGNADIGSLTSFVVTEEGLILACDFKMADIKVFSSDGRWLKTLGRRGQGPGEFGMPLYCDYHPPFYAVMDFGRRKIVIYQKTQGITFRLVSDAPCVALGSDLKIEGRGIVVSGYATDRNGNPFELFYLPWEAGSPRYYLPSPAKYGLASSKEYGNRYHREDDIVSLGTSGIFDSSGGDYFYVWEGRLRILRLSSSGDVIAEFGRVTKNFKKPVATRALRDAYRNESGRKLVEERRKASRIVGLFAGDRDVGLLYADFEPGEEAWTLYLQVYSRDGAFLGEETLHTSSPGETFAARPSFFLRERNLLYVMIHSGEPDYSERSSIKCFRLRAP
jgi:hypothetical protein